MKSLWMGAAFLQMCLKVVPKEICERGVRR
jgi:hypothetical protein